MRQCVAGALRRRRHARAAPCCRRRPTPSSELSGLKATAQTCPRCSMRPSPVSAAGRGRSRSGTRYRSFPWRPWSRPARMRPRVSVRRGVPTRPFAITSAVATSMSRGNRSSPPQTSWLAVGAECGGPDRILPERQEVRRCRLSRFQSTSAPSSSMQATDLPLGRHHERSHRTGPARAADRAVARSLRSQSLSLPSSLPVTSVVPAGSNASAVTGPWWCIGSPRGSPEAAFQRRAVWSSLAVASVLPSGAKASARIGPACASGGPTRQRR